MTRLNKIIATFTICVLHILVAYGESNVNKRTVKESIFISTTKVESKPNSIQWHFTHYTTENGLSSNNVHDMISDKHGFIWFATHYGISRFDGLGFKNYDEAHFPDMKRNDTYHAFKLPNNDIAFGGSNFTICTYNDKTNSFHDISEFAKEKASNFDITGCSFAPDKECLLSSSGMGVFAYDNSIQTFKPICQKLDDKRVLKIFKDFSGKYWIGGYNGVCITNKEGETIHDLRHKIGEPINNILQVDSFHIFLCSHVGSLWLAELDNNYNISQVGKVETPFRSVSAICKLSNDSILIGTSGDGLYLAKVEAKKLDFIKIKPINRTDATISKVSSIYIDNKKRIWISTNDNGVWCILDVAQTSGFTSFDLGIPKSVVSAFSQYGKDSMLVCTDGAGLILLDDKGNVFKHWTTSKGLPSNNVLDIKKYGHGYIISFWGANPILLTEELKLTPLKTNNQTETHINTVKNILRQKNGSYLLSTGGYGVYNLKGDSLSKINLDPTLLNNSHDLWTEQAIELPDGSVRILTSRTIWSNAKGTWTPIYPDLALTNSKNPLLFLQGVPDDKGNYYVLTNRGVYKFFANDSYELLDFLPSGEYFAILRTDNGLLWVTSSNGILSINPEQKNYETIFSLKGLTGDYFVRKSACKAENGKLLFGCKQGFVLINPQNIHKDATEYLALSELYAGGERIDITDNEVATLSYDKAHLNIKIDMVNFADPHTYDLKYRILPEDSTWRETSQTREIEIDFLPNGEHEIEIAMFTPGGGKLKSITQKLTVLPPWWKTFPFILLCLGLAIVIGFLISNRRVASLKRRKEELQKAVDEKTIDLKNTIKLKDQLVSVVAHDLKNPMFAIVTTLRRIKANWQNETEAKQLISEATIEAERVQSEMVKLLQWASQTELNINCNLSNVNLHKLVADIVTFLQPLCNDKEISLTYSLSDIKHHVMADEKMLAVIVRNIISNAIKFTNRGGHINVTAVQNNGRIILTIKDEGIGMSQNTIDKIKNKENVDSIQGTEKEKGHGLGLKVVADFANQMGASLDFESEIGKGTKVSVSMNTGIELETATENNNTSVNSHEGTQNLFAGMDKSFFDNKTILIVDDDKLLLDNIKAMLSEFVSVQTAQNGEEGIRLAEKVVPDLIVSDVDMPNMNGIEMCKLLARNSVTSNIPVLFLSAKKDLSVKIAGLSAGAVDYIVKPFNEGELLLKIFNFLRMQQRRQIRILAGTLNNDCKIDEQHDVDTATEKNEINPLIQQLLDCIQDNYSNPDYSFNDIAKDMGFSKSTLTRRLKSIIDKSPIEILSEYRMHKAKNLLAEGKMSISEVAYAVGFNDPSYFSRKYKEFFGTQPSK